MRQTDGQRKQHRPSRDENPVRIHLIAVAVIFEFLARMNRALCYCFHTALFCIAKHGVAFTWRRQVV